MTTLVQTFNCPRCQRGEFRSLPGVDGKAYCPWCGDAVGGGVAAPPPPPTAVAAPEAPVVPAEPAEDVRLLRERVAELTRRCEQAESGLRQELERKQEIKRAVTEELGRLASQLSDAKAQLQKRDGELERERRQGVELATLREALEAKEKQVKALEPELEERRKAARELQEARDAARRELEQVRGDAAKAKAVAEAELGEQRKKGAALEARLLALKGGEAELGELKAKVQDYRRRLEKERGEFQGKVSSLQSELEKRDQRIRDLQLLIKTLGERLNELTNRRP